MCAQIKCRVRRCVVLLAVLLLLTVIGSAASHILPSREECELKNVIQRFDIGTVKLLQADGYPVERHFITAQDGYIVETHRMPRVGKPVVYVLPGIFQSSRDLLMNCNGRALGHKLYNAGYDVWLGNFRGNTYGRNHSYLSPDSREFWQFRTDDMAMFDTKAAVDYILSVTGQESLNWIGFSLGNTIMFAFLATQPEYNRKIRFAVTIGGPAVYFSSTPSGPVRSLSRNSERVEKLAFQFLGGEVPPASLSSVMYSTAPTLCLREARRKRPGTCSRFFGFIDGSDPGQVTWALLPLIFGGMPSPTSARVVTQWFQWIESGQFTKYDFGQEGNRRNYGGPQPPRYNLSNVTVPLLVFRAGNDLLTPKQDIDRAVRELPNVVKNIYVEWPTWNHLDYLYGKDADLLVYDHILAMLKMYNKFA